MINALVISRLDYCNSMLYGTVDKNFARLRRLLINAKLFQHHACAEGTQLAAGPGTCLFQDHLLVHRAVNWTSVLA